MSQVLEQDFQFSLGFDLTFESKWVVITKIIVFDINLFCMYSTKLNSVMFTG